MVDLRSDTLTMPDYPMLETILTAQLGDDGRTDAKGRGEDPTSTVWRIWPLHWSARSPLS